MKNLEITSISINKTSLLWADYLFDSGCHADKKYLSNLGITKEEFHAITWFTSWAVDADHGSDLPDVIDVKLHLELM